MSRRPEVRADERQREEIRGELHSIVDRLVEALPVLERQRRDMGRGFSTGGGGVAVGGSGSSVVERVALSGESDPAVWAAEALVEWDDWLAVSRRLDRLVRGLLPVEESEVVRGRVNSVELCALCGEPVLEKVRRIDGQPFHASSCYFRVWRAGRNV